MVRLCTVSADATRELLSSENVENVEILVFWIGSEISADSVKLLKDVSADDHRLLSSALTI